MTSLVIQRVLTLPGELAPSTMYIVATADNGIADIVFTSTDGTASRTTANRAFIEAVIAENNAGTVDSLSTARLISITGDAAWEVSFDGSGNVTGALTLASVGTAGEQSGIVTTDAKGRVISSRALLVTDLPDLPGSKITSDISVNTSGNAATATTALHADAADKLTTARTINGVAFDGTANITINAVDSTARIAVSEKGVANGVATLDAAGLVPASQLPSYVDDVIEVADFAALPETGEASKIYVTLDNNYIYRWSGSTYIQIPVGVGLADAALKLNTPVEIAVSGDVAGAAMFDGSENISIEVELEDIPDLTDGEQQPVVTVDRKGRVLSSRALEAYDIPTLDSTTVTSAASVELVAAEW